MGGGKKREMNSLNFIIFNINLLIPYRALCGKKNKKRYNPGTKPCFIEK